MKRTVLVALLYADGQSAKVIAAQLHLTECTVRSYVKRVRKRYGPGRVSRIQLRQHLIENPHR